MNRAFRPMIAVTLAACCLAAKAAGVVEVRFVEPGHYADAGFGTVEIARTTKAFGDYLKKLGAQLPDGQILHIDVLDIKLAGTERPGARRGDFRVLTGRADWPSVTLRYALTTGGQPLKQGTETISDMDYMQRLPPVDRESEFPYEKRMLGEWLAHRFEASPTKPKNDAPQ